MSNYNGWTNYETWLVKLWLDNDQWSQEAMLELAETYHSDLYGLARAVEDAIRELVAEQLHMLA
jgi:hypothetical protein